MQVIMPNLVNIVNQDDLPHAAKLGWGQLNSRQSNDKGGGSVLEAFMTP